MFLLHDIVHVRIEACLPVGVIAELDEDDVLITLVVDCLVIEEVTATITEEVTDTSTIGEVTGTIAEEVTGTSTIEEVTGTIAEEVTDASTIEEVTGTIAEEVTDASTIEVVTGTVMSVEVVNGITIEESTVINNEESYAIIVVDVMKSIDIVCESIIDSEETIDCNNDREEEVSILVGETDMIVN